MMLLSSLQTNTLKALGIGDEHANMKMIGDLAKTQLKFENVEVSGVLGTSFAISSRLSI